MRAGPAAAGSAQQLGQLRREPLEERLVPARPTGRVGHAAADPQPVLRLVEQAVGDADDPGEGQTEAIRAGRRRAGDRLLDGEQRTLVLADAELGERELVVPAQQAPVRLAEQVADGRRVVRPADQGEGRVEDDRDAEIEPAATVEDEIPAGDPVALGPLDGLEAQVGEPALDVGRRARPRGRRGRRMAWPAESSRERRTVAGRCRRRSTPSVALAARALPACHAPTAATGVRATNGP